MGFDDCAADAITDILKGVAHYNEYSKDHKQQTISALAHLYLIMFESFPSLSPNAKQYTIKEARKQATKEWMRAYARQDYYD